MAGNSQKHIAVWLLICCFMVFMMVVIGGLTRLTESGLSITEWKPVSGIVPPIREEHWQEEFTAYKKSPEYIQKNFDMSLAEFKNIFWLEFIHRLVGRVTGFVFLFPFLFFIFRKHIDGKLSIKLGGIFLLGGMQGVIGWYMVKSGLVDDPRVSPYRLALHLGMAFIIFALLWWEALRLWNVKTKVRKNKKYKQIRNISYFVTGIIFLQVTAGAFVAGLDAGLTYNTFPLMDGQWIPDGMFIKNPFWVNFFENITTVQFQHRLMAFLVLFSVVLLILKFAELDEGKEMQSWLLLLLGLVLAQIGLGIATLVMVVPIHLASIHQAVALVIFAVSLFINWKLYARVGGNRRI